MAMNDFVSLDTRIHGSLEADSPDSRYFIRLLCGALREVWQLIDVSQREDGEVAEFVPELPPESQVALQDLSAIFLRTPREDDEEPSPSWAEEHLRGVRNGTFHYPQPGDTEFSEVMREAEGAVVVIRGDPSTRPFDFADLLALQMAFGDIDEEENLNRGRPVPWPELYEETFQFIEVSERLGLDQVWLPEHHFSEDGFNPSLMVTAAAIASRTSKIRIGTKILILPFHDPVRLSEDIAVVDQISGGRLDIGLAGGYRKKEFDAFGIPHAERGRRMEEGLDVLRQALTGKPFEHDGEFHHYGTIEVNPPPAQDPVPLFLGGRSKAAMRRAASHGAHLVLADFDVESCQADIARYKEALVDVGRDPEGARIVAVSTIFADESAARAWEIAGPHLLYQQNQWRSWFNEVSDREEELGLLKSVEEISDAAALVGTPAEILEKLMDFRENVDFTELSFFTLLPGMRGSVGTPALELFASEIAPRLRGESV